jgi:hypothetical protein
MFSRSYLFLLVLVHITDCLVQTNSPGKWLMLTKLHIIAGEKTNDLPTITYLNQVRLVLQICFIDSGIEEEKI